MRTATATRDDLFAPAMLQLVEDDEGGARYWPGFVDADIASAWFDALRARSQAVESER